MGCRPEQCLSLLPTNQCPPTILFNHESPRRGETFVTRKITRGLARIDAGLGPCPRLRGDAVAHAAARAAGRLRDRHRPPGIGAALH